MPLFNPPAAPGGSGSVTSVGLTTSGVLHTVTGSPITGAGTLALTLKTQVAGAILAGPLSGADAAPTMRALDPLDVPALDAAKITSGTFGDARLASGITGSKISGALTGATLATSALTGTIAASQLAVSAPTSGQLSGLVTGNLSATAGILGSQLDSAAAIASGQITSLAAAKLTGTNTLPDGVLSANVPMLASANTFTAAQTISATVAGVLAQVNNASTTGAGLLIGSTTVASAGAGIIAPALALTQAPPATTRYGLLSVGSGFWDGSTTGKFVSSASGCLYAGNAASGFGGNLLDLQLAGVSKAKIDSSGNTTLTSVSASGAVACTSIGIANNSTGSNITFSGSAPVAIKSTNAAVAPLIVKSVASQTADLQQWQDSAAAVQFGIMNGGSAGSPVWALRVRATANAESMAVSHTAGAATGKCIQVFDDAGTSLGYLSIVA